ncbi:unnamed protein product [Trichobilharzia regenti]|nr:unnamed protein product [Trichobilharzia regenti]
MKPEWTVWKRGMRLSFGHGRIGLARLQQLTRTNCALLRNHSLDKSNSRMSNNSPVSSSLSCSTSLCDKNDLSSILQYYQQNLLEEEWDEPCAIEGEEVLTRNRKFYDNNKNDNNNNCYLKENSSTLSTASNAYGVYRSGVVETIQHSYEGRYLRLMHWTVEEEEEVPTITEGTVPTKSSPITSSPASLKAMAAARFPFYNSSTVKTVSDFALRNNGHLVDEEHGNSTLDMYTCIILGFYHVLCSPP